MTWLLVGLGVALAVAGLWGASRRGAQRTPAPEPPPADDRLTRKEAWDELSRPVHQGDELIRLPDRGLSHFQRGVLVGLGAGMVVAGLGLRLLPTLVVSPQPQVAAERDGGVSRGARPAPAPVTQPPASPPKPANITFVVEPGASAPEIAARLRSAGLIADEAAFLSRVQDRGVDTLLKAGTFIVPTDAPVDKVIDALTA